MKCGLVGVVSGDEGGAGVTRAMLGWHSGLWERFVSVQEWGSHFEEPESGHSLCLRARTVVAEI